MATPQNHGQSSLLDTGNTRPAIRVLAGRLRLTSYRPFPILLDPSDPLVQESKTEDVHFITFVGPEVQEDSAAPVRFKGFLSAFAMRAVAGLRRVLDHV